MRAFGRSRPGLAPDSRSGPGDECRAQGARHLAQLSRCVHPARHAGDPDRDAGDHGARRRRRDRRARPRRQQAGSSATACSAIRSTGSRAGSSGETVHGGLAEYLPAARASAHPHPGRRQLVEQAAALPCAYGTARRMMARQRPCRGGREGADPRRLGRGLGVCCVQLAKLVGATVIAAAGYRGRRRRG